MSDFNAIEMTQDEVDELPPRPLHPELGDVWVDHYGGNAYRVAACMWGDSLGTNARRIIIIDHPTAPKES